MTDTSRSDFVASSTVGGLGLSTAASGKRFLRMARNRVPETSVSQNRSEATPFLALLVSGDKKGCDRPFPGILLSPQILTL